MSWTPSQRARARRLATATVFFAAILGLWRLLRSLNVELVISTLRTSALGWVAAAFACGLLAQVTRAVGWRALLPVHVGFVRLVVYEFIAQASSAVSPEGAGELVRVGLLRREGMGSTTTLTMMVVRKLFSSLGLVPLLILMVGPGTTPRWAKLTATGYVLVLVLVSTAVVCASRPVGPGVAPLGKVATLLRDVRTALEVLRQPRALTGVAGSSVLTRLLDLAALLLLARALSLHVSVATAVLVLLLVEVSNALPTAPGQLGTFEVAALTALVTTLPHEDAVALTLAFHAEQLLPQVMVGALLGLAHLTRKAARRVQR